MTSSRVSPSLASRAIKSASGLAKRRIADRTRSRVSDSHLGICRAARLLGWVTAWPGARGSYLDHVHGDHCLC